MENEEKRAEDVQPAPEAVAEAVQPALTAEELQRLEDEMKLRQNMPKGVLASVVVGLACAALWALITA